MDTLPKGIVPIRDIIDGKHKTHSFVSVMGVVTDFRAPISTRHTDWKCELRIYDASTEDDATESLLVSVFRPKEQMPDVKCGDVVLILEAKLQQYQLNPLSLLSSRKTAIHVFPAEAIQKPPLNALKALKTPTDKSNRPPNAAEFEYVSVLYHGVNKERLPTVIEFGEAKERSLNVKNKFGLLKDAEAGKFIEVFAQVVREPYDLGDKFTLWISDYTENYAFYNQAFKLPHGKEEEETADDPYDYTKKKASKVQEHSNDWTGPLGKRSLQISCFEPHATAIRECKIKNGSWVRIRNLQMKFGQNASNLEGYLRTDDRVHIYLLDPLEDAENMEPELKEAIRRKRDYEKQKKKQLKDIKLAVEAGRKRKAMMESDSTEPPVKMNSKARRKGERAQIFEKARQEGNQDTPPLPDLNPSISCENPHVACSGIADLTEKVTYTAIVNGETVTYTLPFVNLKHRANVRVVDYFPHKLEDFTRPVKPQAGEFNALSDNEAESDSDHSEDEDMMKNFTEANWTWRFYLLLEDASMPAGRSKNRIWVAVSNEEAQCLTNLDASNLKLRKEDVQRLRERMFTLWGELEEHVTCREERKAKAVAAAKANLPPAATDPESTDEQPVRNRPFTCCIRQYGCKVPEDDPRKADAGEGFRWQRMYGLFGTKIKG